MFGSEVIQRNEKGKKLNKIEYDIMISGLNILLWTDLSELAIGKCPEEGNFFVCAYFMFVRWCICCVCLYLYK